MESILLSRRKLQRLSRQLSVLLMLCGCSKIIVKPGVKVITIEPSADALSMEEVVKLFSIDAHFALPSYSQDKRKVERCVQNLNREFVDHL